MVDEFTTERSRLIVARHESGETLSEIGRTIGISRARAASIAAKHKMRVVGREDKIKRWGGDFYGIVGNRYTNCLERCGIRDLKSLIELVSEYGVEKSGSTWKSKKDGTFIRNVGDVAWMELIFPYLRSIGIECKS